MKISSLEEAFMHELSDVYSAENQITKALPKLADAASNSDLVEGFETHLRETEGQIEKLEEFVKANDLSLKRIKCKAVEGLVEEGEEIIKKIQEGPVRDAMLIGAAQKVEHYEIASYGCLVEMAKKLGYQQVDLLEDILDEEKATDKKLNELAVSKVNDEALKKAA